MPSLFRSPNCTPQLQPPISTPNSRARFSYCQAVTRCSFLRHPEIIALNQHSVLRNVRDINRIAALIENVSTRCGHAALRCKANTGLFADFVKLLCRC